MKKLSKTERLRIIVLDFIVRGPLGGMVWSKLQYLQGLMNLGHDVYYLEDSADYPSCYDPVSSITSTNATYGLEFAGRVLERIGFGGRWAYYDAHTSRWFGACSDSVLQICQTADLLINLCGINPLRHWLMDVSARIFVDQDPVFTQIGHLTEQEKRDEASRHTAFFSFGENMSSGRSSVPNDGFIWHDTRQPVVLENTSITPGPSRGKFTTVMLWKSYPPRKYNGILYGVKSDSFEPYMDLPHKAGRIFELAIGSSSAPRAQLRSLGWKIRDSRQPTRDPWTFLHYIERSKAEFSVAKQGYVACRSGWFSERSVAYLTSGRPVLVQDTGFSDWLPSGSGVIGFHTPEEAVTGIEDINSRYEHHCRAAREIAAEYFDSRKVLSYLIERAMSSKCD